VIQIVASRIVGGLLFPVVQLGIFRPVSNRCSY
jgi:hypothetical protein